MKLTILQWNILYKEKMENVIRLLRKINPDIACLQELTVHSERNHYKDIPAEIARTLKAEYVFGVAQVQRNANSTRVQFGNGIFSRLPIVKRYVKYLRKPAPETRKSQDGSTPGRMYVEADIGLGRRTLTVATTHLSGGARFSTTPEKKNEVKLLVGVIKKRKRDFVLTGDFNALPRSPVLRAVQTRLKNCGPVFREKTFANWALLQRGYVAGSFAANSLDWRIDYALATPDVKVVSSRVIKTPHSDHLPILVEISV